MIVAGVMEGFGESDRSGPETILKLYNHVAPVGSKQYTSAAWADVITAVAREAGTTTRVARRGIKQALDEYQRTKYPWERWDDRAVEYTRAGGSPIAAAPTPEAAVDAVITSAAPPTPDGMSMGVKIALGVGAAVVVVGGAVLMSQKKRITSAAARARRGRR
jgi:hypothetical protein